MNKIRLTSGRGFSIVELMIVVVIVTVISVFAVSRFTSSTQNFDRQNIARAFKVSLERARFDSVKRRANVCSDMSRVTINSPTSYSVTSDLNQTGSLETTETRTFDFGNRSDVTMVGNGITFPVTIRFDQRGHAVLSDCVSTPPPNVPLLYFCNGSCTSSTATTSIANVLFISPTGTVAMLDGGASMPTFADPAVSTVDANVQVNPLLAVWAPTTPGTTPTPTPTPVSSLTPTPTPTPVSSPTPPPTPSYCSSTSPWERPADTGCSCRLPMWVRNNGQCK